MLDYFLSLELKYVSLVVLFIPTYSKSMQFCEIISFNTCINDIRKSHIYLKNVYNMVFDCTLHQNNLFSASSKLSDNIGTPFALVSFSMSKTKFFAMIITECSKILSEKVQV